MQYGDDEVVDATSCLSLAGRKKALRISAPGGFKHRSEGASTGGALGQRDREEERDEMYTPGLSTVPHGSWRRARGPKEKAPGPKRCTWISRYVP